MEENHDLKAITLEEKCNLKILSKDKEIIQQVGKLPT